MPTVGYARISSPDRKNDLVRQQELLEAFCAAKGWRYEVIADRGSGLNPRRKGLHHLFDLILHKRIRRLVLTNKPQDVIKIITLLGARLYGSRSPKTKRLIEERGDDGSPKVTPAFKTDDSAPDPVVRLLIAMHEAQARKSH